jgi:hypothetical protein
LKRQHRSKFGGFALLPINLANAAGAMKHVKGYWNGDLTAQFAPKTALSAVFGANIRSHAPRGGAKAREEAPVT